MKATRRIELILMAVTTALAVAIALLVEPLPPLLHLVESPGWTRAIEAVLILLVEWMLLSVAGFIKAEIGLGDTGVTAQRAPEDAANTADAADENTLAALQEMLAETREDAKRWRELATRLQEQVLGLTNSAPRRTYEDTDRDA